MTTLEHLNRWRGDGTISAEQHSVIAALIARRRVSVFVELNALLYLGVLACAGGLGWTVRTYAAQWGDLAILLPATAVLVACLWYCFDRIGPFSRDRVDAQSLVFDYVLYLACLVFAVELGYVEYRFHLLREQWDSYLLLSSLLYLGLAYRFDNRFVLSLGIATLGGWFGVRITRFGASLDSAVRLAALAYGVLVALIGWAVHAVRVKPHFLETYLHVAANVALAALLSGVVEEAAPSLWFAGLLLVAGGAVAGGVRSRRFAFLVYGVVWGYIGVSRELLRNIHDATSTLSYFVVSAGAVIVGLVILSRRFAREE